MLLLGVLLPTLSHLAAAAPAQRCSRFSVVTPQSAVPGQGTAVLVYLAGHPEPANVTLRLLGPDRQQVIASNSLQIQGEGTVPLSVPASASGELLLETSVDCGPATSLQGAAPASGSRSLAGGSSSSRSASSLRLVGPLRDVIIRPWSKYYKPGETVEFWVLALDHDLRIATDLTGTVALRDPTGVRVALWEEVPLDQGVRGFSLRLSEEARTGLWSAEVQIGGGGSGSTFSSQLNVSLARGSRDPALPEQPIAEEHFVELAFSKEMRRRYKPGLPFVGKVEAVSSEKGVRVRVKVLDNTTSIYSQDIEMPDGSFLVPAILSDSQRITLQAELVSVGGKETDSHYVLAREEVFKWNSTSSCYLLVESLQPTLQPGDEAKAVVLSSCPCERDLRYLVTTEGHVSYWNEQRISPVRLGSEENISGAPLCRFNFTFTVEAVMAPVSHLLVYYVTDQGEPISDVISFDVKLLQRQVSVNIEQKKFWYPGETMDLQILSDLGSLVCLVGGRGPDLHSQKIGRGLEVEPSEAGVSYYWADLSGREEFRPARSGRHHSVMSEAGLDQLWLWNCFNYTSEVEAQGLRLPGPPEPGKWSLGALSISAATGLRFAYPTLLTVFQPVEVDFRLPQTFRVGESLEVDIRIGNNLNSCVDVNALLTLGEGAHFLGSSQPYVAEKLRLGPHGATSLVVRVVATSPGLKNMTVEVSAYNSETCQSLASELGNHTRVGTVSKVRSILVTPEGLVKTHIESAYFCANEQMVISTSEEFKYEFIPSPHNREAVVFEARAGAGLHVALSEERDTTARMYQVVIGDQGNTVSWIGRGKHGYSVHLLSANSPSILSSDESRTFWLSWDQGVLAFGRGPAVHESVVLKTRREKKMKFNFIGFATNWGQAAEIRVWNYNDEAGFSQVLHLDIPRSVLPGSETGTLVVGGGLSLPSPRRVPGLRPSLSEYSSLATAIASLAPLLADDRVKSEGNQTKSQITSHQLELISELQKLYLFKRKDGSFSDHKNTSSLWNSLEVLDLLSRVQERTRVDPELIVGLKEWILGRQAGDGSFPGHFMSGGGAVRSNMSGMSGEDEAIAVTSFALVTLINVGLESERDSAVMEKARDYLEKRLERTSDGSALGLLCLALATSRSARLEAGLARLRNASTNEEGEFGWPHPLDTSSSSWLVEEGHLKEFRASLFALMTYTKLGDLKSAEAAARYLFYRAYILDTHTELMLSAVKAFSEFGRLAQDPHRWLTVSLATSGMELTDTLELRPRSGVQHLALPSLPTKVFVYATGAGCATVQGEISYATYSAARTTSLFELWAGVTEEILPRRNSIQELEGKLPILNIKTCFKWKGVGSSGVVRLEVHLFSGFELLRVAPNEMDLEYGSRGDRIWFVLYNVSSECAVCLEFSAKSDYVVSRLRPAFARVYPAGRSDLAAELFFHARRGSPLLADTSEDDLITWFGPGRAAGESDGLSSDFSQICACGQVCVDEGEASLSSTTITSAPDKDRGESQSKEVGDDDLEVRKSVDKVGTQEELDKRDGKDKASEMNEESKNIENGTKGEVKKMLSDDKKEEGGMLQQEGIKQVDNGTQGDGDKKLAADKQKQADNEATESNPQQVEDSKQAEESTDFTDIIVLSELKDSSSTTEGEFKTIEELSKELGINATTDGFIFETSHHASTAMDATTQASTTLSPTKAKTFKKELKVSKLKKLKPKSSEIPNEPAHGSPLYKREKHIDIITRNITGTIDSPLTSVQVENKEHITIRNLSESSPEVSDLSEMNSKHLNKELKHLGSSGVLEPLERPSLNVAESAELAKDRGQTLLKDEGEGSLEVLRGQDSEKSQLRSPAG